MSKHGTRLVQRLLDVLGPGDFETLVKDLTFCTVELYQSPWGNHALTKMIEKSAFSLMSPVIERIAEEGPVKVATHKFGCRVFDRLFEQAAEKDMTGLLMTGLIDPLVDAVETLSVHKFGNFVIQKLLEHGSDSNRSRIMQALLPSLPRLAFLKTASNVAQSVLSFCNPEEQRAIAETFLGAEARYGLEALAVDRFGSYVVEDLLGSDLADISGAVSDRFTEAPEVYSAHLAVIAARGAKQKEP